MGLKRVLLEGARSLHPMDDVNFWNRFAEMDVSFLSAWRLDLNLLIWVIPLVQCPLTLATFHLWSWWRLLACVNPDGFSGMGHVCLNFIPHVSMLCPNTIPQNNKALTHPCLQISSEACPVNGWGGDEPYINPELFHKYCTNMVQTQDWYSQPVSYTPNIH